MVREGQRDVQRGVGRLPAHALNERAEPVDASDALLELGRVPGEVVMHHVPAVMVEVEPLLHDLVRDEDHGVERGVELLAEALARLAVDGMPDDRSFRRSSVWFSAYARKRAIRPCQGCPRCARSAPSAAEPLPADKLRWKQRAPSTRPGAPSGER